MHLNLPIYEKLWEIQQNPENPVLQYKAQNILIAGAGGGFDIYAGLPLYYELWRSGHKVHLFNYSFTDLYKAQCELKIEERNNNLYGFQGNVTVCPTRKEKNYFPEGYLAEWLAKTGKRSVVWASPKSGVAPLRKAFGALVEKLNLDVIILVDGGVDSLMRGDEVGCGSILEDTVSLAAATNTGVKLKLLAAVGMGTELDDGVNHYRVLENMAALCREQAFLGSCSLVGGQEAFKFMSDGYNYAISTENHAVSHITPRIIAGATGTFGDDRTDPVITKDGRNLTEGKPGYKDSVPIFHSILMGVYWFFDANFVAMQNKLIDKTFRQTNIWPDVMMAYRQKLPTLTKRADEKFPY